jgi:divalent metal cation (Fe/Co/Zn/Cd) transporter
LVSFVILKQSFGLLYGTWGDLTDAGVSQRTCQSLKNIVEPLVNTELSPSSLLSVSDIRARKAGSLMYVDLTARVPPQLSMLKAQEVEESITETLKKEKREVADVRVRFVTDQTL